MSTGSLGLGGIVCGFRRVARPIAHGALCLSLTTAAMSSPLLAQVGLPGFSTGTDQPAHTFAVAPNDEEFTGQVDAIHSPNIDQMVDSRYKLDVARRHSQLVITRRNVRRIHVTDSDIVNYVQFSPTELSIVGQQLGTTDLTLWFEGEAIPSRYEVTVVRDENIEEQRRIDFGRLERKLAIMFPNSNVYLTPVGVQVHVRGQAADAKTADQILQVVRTEVINSYGRYGDIYNQTAYGGNGTAAGPLGASGLAQQIGTQFGGLNDIVVNDLTVPGAYNVMLRVIIAEINRNGQRDANVDLSVAFNNGRHVINTALGGATGTTVGGILENGQIQTFIRWLQTNGTVSLLSEPTLVTMSGHPASLLGGGEFAVPTIIGLGGGQQTSFRGVGTSMVVTPTVIDRDLMRLQVQAEFSEISIGNAVNGIPGTTAKRVQTTVELREGQTLAIGGLMSRQMSSSVSRIPLLGAIPFLGTRLFHSRTSSEGDTELLVLVSPEIVNPMEPDEVPPLPNFYVTHPNNHDLWHYARTEGNPDQNVYQTQPYGSGATIGIPQGYNLFNPPASGPGFQTGLSSGFNGMQPSQSLMPQSNSHLPPAHQMQPYQSAPSASQTAPQIQPPPALNAPVQPGMPGPPIITPPSAEPQTPLPPVPGQQHSLNLPQTQQSGLTTRLTSMFRRKSKPAQKTSTPFSTIGWRR